MGLSTVHGIIIELGGFVAVYSETNQGTVTLAFIPLISEPVEIESNETKKPLKGCTERIQFVDDEQIQIKLSEEALSRYGYQITAAVLKGALTPNHRFGILILGPTSSFLFYSLPKK